MLKHLLTRLPLAVAALMVATAVPAQAAPPMDAAGLWQYLPTVVGVRDAGCNQFVSSTEHGIWTGTFVGESTEVGQVSFHCNGHVNFKAIVTFEEVTVDGRTGSLEMTVNGILPDPTDPDWQGHWTIQNGTGELEQLRGHGTFDGPGYNPAQPDRYGDIYYEGKIHFTGR